MIRTLESADAASLAAFDDIIDVRSPAEFADDHAPGAINLPVLDDAQRAEVGTIYVQESRFLARRIGAAHVARNIARHLETGLKEKPSAWAPLVYCWRGGQRSNAMATVLAQVGWRVGVLAGGYRTYRRRVTQALYDGAPKAPRPLEVVLLDGYTGVAKTDVLNRLAMLGVQTLDLEDLAAHRGSLFGALADRTQPSQKAFESSLLAALERLDHTRRIVVEAESSKIGALMIPPVLWKAMLVAPRIELTAPMAERARYLTRAYGDIVADPAALDQVLAKLPTHHGRERLDVWREMARAGDHAALAADLIERHYDPAYERSRRQDHRPRLAVVELADLSPSALEAAAGAVVHRLAAEEG